MSLAKYYLKKLKIDEQEIDSSLILEEQFTEIKNKFGLLINKNIIPYQKDFIEWIEKKQEEKYKRYCKKHLNKNRNKIIKPYIIDNTIYCDNLNFNLLNLWKNKNKKKRKIKKQLYKRINLSKKREDYSINIEQICRKLPNIDQSYLYKA